MANDSLLTIREVRRALARTDVTIGRWVKAGILPEPIYVNGIRAWRAEDISATLDRLRAKPPRSFPPGKGDGGRDLGHTLKREEAELEQAAARALSLAGVAAVGQVLERFAPSGRLVDIASDERRNAIRALNALSLGARPC
jgi:hypothetical protein